MSRIIVFLVLISNLSFGQAALDGPFVSERFQVYNGLVNFKIWSIGDFLVMNANQFELDISDVNFIKNNNINQFEANYLFQEESHWVKRLYRTIIFDDHTVNNGLNVLKTTKGNVSLGDFIQENFSNNKLMLFRNEDYNFTVSKSDLNLDELKSIVGIKFKQDFAYNRMTNKLDVYISGFAPIISLPSGEYKELLWLNYNNFKGEAGAQGVKSLLLSNLKAGKYYASVDRIENSIMKGVVDRSYQNDLDALVSLKLLEESLALTPEIYRKEGSFKIKVDAEEVKGNITQGVLNGVVTVKHKALGVTLSVEYKKGIPSGKFISYYAKGRVKEEGSFVDGLREETWSSYYKNGKLKSRKEYITGFLSGKQELFYENGNLRDRYSFENNKLSGEFTSNYKDGVQKCRGKVVNGLVTGDWKYTVRLNKKYQDLIAKNPSFWDARFKVVKEWDSKALQASEFTFEVKYDHQPGDNCLNQLCPKMTVVKVGE